MRGLAVLLAAMLVTSADARASGAIVVIHDMAFSRPSAALTSGDTLTFTNSDSFQHTATVPGEFDLVLKPGQSQGVVLNHAGTFEVTCRYHPTMKLKIVVQPAPANTHRPHSYH